MLISNDQKRVRKTLENVFSGIGASWYLMHFDCEKGKLITAGYQSVSVLLRRFFILMGIIPYFK